MEIPVQRAAGAAEPPVSRTFAVLEYLASQGKPVAVAEAAAALGLSAPTAHRICVQLEDQGYLRRAAGSKRFVMAPRLEQLGLAIVRSALRDAPRHAILQALTDAIGEQCELGVMAGSDIVYVDRGLAPVPASLHFDPGHRAPLHCTSIGKMYLALLPDEPRERLLESLVLTQFTPNTITDAHALLREVAAAKARGWATSNEEFVLGVVGCGVPVLNSRGTMLAGLAISVPSARLSLAAATTHIPALQSAAQKLAATL